MSTATAAAAALEVRVPEDPAARVAFSDRGAGNLSLVVGRGDPVRGRARLPGVVGLPEHAAVFMQQEHGAGVATVGRVDAGRGVRTHADAIPNVDALVTREADVALVVLVADCVPVLLVDPGRAVGAVHAGRRGIAAGVLDAAVSALTDTPHRTVAVLGPAIGGCCYEVPEELVEEVAVPSARRRTQWGTPSLDLPTAAVAQLRRAGVVAIRQVGECTRCAADRWFSHRADRPADTGRQAGVVCRRSDVEPPPAAPGGCLD